MIPTVAIVLGLVLVLLAIRAERRRRRARAVEWLLSVSLMLAIARLLVERPGFVEGLGDEATRRIRRALGLDS